MQIILILVFALIVVFLKRKWCDYNRGKRQDYYRNVYLKSDAWQRKRYVVFKRDNWRCVYCGAPATQVHHKQCQKKYRKRANRLACFYL
jgi:hypothetical protein